MEYSKHKAVGNLSLLIYDTAELTDSLNINLSISTINNASAIQKILDSLKETGLNVELRNTTVEI